MAQASRPGAAALLEGFNQLGNAQKLGFILGAAAVIALITGLWLWSRTPDYRVLFSNISDRDGGAIIATLQQMNIPYQMAEGGGAILVPSNQVYEARLKLASQGLPRGGAVGFELMETQKLGASQFLEQVNYQRALEGELARTIQSLAAVQGARVHLAIPRPSVFIRESQKPSASVLISVYPGRTLESGQVGGIIHLVASSVPDLPVKNVTVVDQAGNLLSGQADSAASGLDPAQLSYLHQVEQSYVKRIEAIVAPITGADNVRAQVAASLDFSLVEQTSESFKPNPAPAEAAVRSQQSTETLGSGAQGAGGVPGALSNQPPGAASAPLVAPAAAPAARTAAAPAAPENVHKESTVNYELDKTIRHMKSPMGAVKRLSVAVVVNYRKTTDKGKVSFKPLAEQEMAQITNLVKEAVGFSQERGDTVNVVNAAFSAGEKEEVAPLPIWKDPANIAVAREVGKNLLIAGVFFYLIFGVLRPTLRELMRAGQRATAAREAAMAAQPASYGGAPRAANYEEDLRAVREIAKEDPRIVANVVKDWVGNE